MNRFFKAFDLADPQSNSAGSRPIGLVPSFGSIDELRLRLATQRVKNQTHDRPFPLRSQAISDRMGRKCEGQNF